MKIIQYEVIIKKKGKKNYNYLLPSVCHASQGAITSAHPTNSLLLHCYNLQHFIGDGL